MGHWTTYRRRGSSAAKTSALQAPPAPIISVVDDNLLQDAQGETDTGGFCKLYSSPTGAPPWTLYQVLAWLSEINWGSTGDLPAAYYEATEVGNGIKYQGESAPSNILHLA